jgi:CDGSH-type Zn-finger protein/uncharacterized Fe-S cluster protein YjdI
MTPATHRDQLVSMLAEAAEIEHCLMCTYLFAAFSLKQELAEDLSEHELAAVRRWRAEVVSIATEEMLHLALVNNLLTALGARPHYRRFNFPIGAGLFPADVAVALLPFDADTLDHFIYLERPADADEHDGGKLDKPAYTRTVAPGRLSEANADYSTVGELYEAIKASLAPLAATLGERALFAGPVEAQLSHGDLFLPGLCTIATVAQAERAIDLIVLQGEGADTCNERSHYARFRVIRTQWHALLEARPGFVPQRPVARNPVMRSPVTATDRVQVVAEPAASLLDIGNASYNLMLRLLALMSDTEHCSLDRPALMAQAMTLMHAVADIGASLSRLPANPDFPGANAGLTFTVSRTALSYQSRDSAAALLAERMGQLAEHAECLAGELAALAPLAERLRAGAAQWRASVKAPDARVATDASAPASAPVAAPADAPEDAPVPASASARSQAPTPDQATPSTPGMTDTVANNTAATDPGASDDGSGVEFIRGTLATIRFEARRCVHSRHCVLGEPEVFVANKPGEWIYPDRATPERLAFVAQNCVSGAIQLIRHDGAADEAPPLVNLVHVRENGPLHVHANLRITPADGADGTLIAALKDIVNNAGADVVDGEPVTIDTAASADTELRATLCRCGMSANKPYCDGSHVAARFTASGEMPTRPSQPMEWRNGPLHVTPLRDGPLDVRGAAEIVSGTGRTVDRTMIIRLCRCGQSKDKPFCDNSHRAAGFQAEGR